MKKALLIMTLSTLAAGCADNSIPRADLPELDTSNPLLAEWKTPHATPPFDRIEPADYEPARRSRLSAIRSWRWSARASC